MGGGSGLREGKGGDQNRSFVMNCSLNTSLLKKKIGGSQVGKSGFMKKSCGNSALNSGLSTVTKRRVNSRNTIKNIVNQMISFLSSPECYPILENLCKDKSLDIFNMF